MKRLLVACLLTVLSTVSASAFPLASSEGFESPTYSAGDLGGQDGWLALGGGATSATVQSDVVARGAQAIRLDREANSNGYWAQLVNSAPSGRFVSIDWDMRVEAPTITSGVGPFFGIQVFDDSDGPIRQLAGFGVDAVQGAVQYQTEGEGALINVAAATPGEWNHYRIELDFFSDSYRVIYNEALAFDGHIGFIDAGSNDITRLTDIDLVGLVGGPSPGDGQQTGTAYFDNVLVRDGLRGDYNSDGVIDAADYTVLRDQFGQTGFALAADGDANGQVDDEGDYAIWSASYGLSNALASPSALAVPEPGAALLSLAGLTAWACRPRRRS